MTEKPDGGDPGEVTNGVDGEWGGAAGDHGL